jgi:hypothetical protein
MHIVAALIALLLSFGIARAETFEGIVNARIGTGEGGRPPVEAQYSMREGKLRMEVQAHGATEGARSIVIMDPMAKTGYILMPAQKMYMAMPVMSHTGAEERNPEIVKTGRKEKIAGYDCEHWTIKDKTGDFDACVATGLAAFPSGMGRDAGWSNALRDHQGFPLKVARAGGATIMEVTKIEKKKLDAALFTVPADYTKRDMPSGMPPRPRQP